MLDATQQLQADLYKSRLARKLIDRNVPAPIADHIAEKAAFEFKDSGLLITVGGGITVDTPAEMTKTIDRLVKQHMGPPAEDIVAAHLKQINDQRASAPNPLMQRTT